jgi:para-nitrobenzyl esterase
MAHTVSIDSGALEGVEGDGYVKYLGVPYAAPPVGDLRWRAPQAPPAWSGVRKADRFGPSCIQPPLPLTLATAGDDIPQSEDCLYLNVWAPRGAAGRKLPVMMWIHGGSYIIGSGSWPTYDGAVFARQDIVYVSINYRLNYFGFFAHPALTAENADGVLANYGILDQIAALQWIQRNIEAFGGDPGNVTVFGESAGGTFTNLLMLSPLSKGLFHRAIVQSAPAFQRWRRLKGAPDGPSKVERMGEAHAQAIGAAGQDVAALRAVESDKVMGEVGKVWGANLGPIVDGAILPEREAEAYEAGLQHRVPLMIGANSYEASLMAGYPVANDTLIDSLGPDRAATLSIYDPAGARTLDEVAKDIYGDRQFVSPARYIAKQAAKTQPVHLYHFSYVPEALRGSIHGASHGSEIAFVFEAAGSTAMTPYAETAADRAMARVLNRYWVNFARTGDPNGPGLPAWPTCPPDVDLTMEFSAEGAVLRQGFLAERLDLVEPIAKSEVLR